MATKTKRRLVGFVHVTDPDSGRYGSFGPDDDVPEWAEKLITNDEAWESEASEAEGPEFLTQSAKAIVAAAEDLEDDDRAEYLEFEMSDAGKKRVSVLKALGATEEQLAAAKV